MAGDDNSRMNENLIAIPRIDGAARLIDWGVIRAVGPDARSFLHNQLTNDLLHLDATQARLAGYCSAKGRLLASFVVWCATPEEVLLACSADVLPAALKRLSMFVLRAKCKLSDASAEIGLWGLAGDAAALPGPVWTRNDAADRATLIKLPEAIVVGRSISRALRAAPRGNGAESFDALNLDTWRWLEVHSGTARIVAATVEQFVPQMVNLELVGGVNFQKGCYPGQEIVARSQYRGTIKRRAFVVASDVALAPGQELFQRDDATQPAGMVVLAGSRGTQHAALVELKLVAAQTELHAGSVEGPLIRLGALPYLLPTDAA